MPSQYNKSICWCTYFWHIISALHICSTITCYEPNIIKQFRTMCLYTWMSNMSFKKSFCWPSSLQFLQCLPLSFCKAIGLRELYTITLKTSMSSTSWLVRVFHYPNCSMVSGSGWTGFCHENRISVGDVCTFEIIETTQWHVIIERPEASTK